MSLKEELEIIKEEGKKYIIEAKVENFQRYIKRHEKEEDVDIDLFKDVIEIMKDLSAGKSLEYINEKTKNEMYIKKNHSGPSWYWVVSNVAFYHKDGVDFALENFKHLGLELSNEQIKEFKDLKRKNEELIKDNQKSISRR